MMNIKIIIILLSLAAYASCGLFHSKLKAEAPNWADQEMEFVTKFENLQIDGKSDDEIIKDAFDLCKEWVYFKECLELTGITLYQFTSYMVHPKDDFYTFQDYVSSFGFEKSLGETSVWIDLPIFSIVFKDHCLKLNTTVKQFAQERKDTIILSKKKTLNYGVKTMQLWRSEEWMNN